MMCMTNGNEMCCRCRSFVCNLVSTIVDCQPRVRRTEVPEWCCYSLWEDRSRRTVWWVMYFMLLVLFCYFLGILMKFGAV